MTHKEFKRIHLIVLDSVGIGEAPGAEAFVCIGSDTLGHMAEAVGGLSMPNMEKLGLGNIKTVEGIAPVTEPEAYFGRLQEASVGKDTMTGHWEIMGLNIDTP